MTSESNTREHRQVVLGELLLSLYLDRSRRRVAREAFRVVQPNEQRDTMIGLAASEDRKFPDTADLRKEFRKHIEVQTIVNDREWALEDIQPTLERLTAGLIDLPSWFEAIHSEFKIGIYFEREAPRVSVDHLFQWSRLTSRLDGDAFLCFLLANRGWEDQIDSLSGWGLVTRISDRNLDALARRGVTDLHLHLGGARSSRLSWLAVLTGEIEVRQLPRYAPKHARASRFDADGSAGAETSLQVQQEAELLVEISTCFGNDAKLDDRTFPGMWALACSFRKEYETAIRSMQRHVSKDAQELSLQNLQARLVAERFMLAKSFARLSSTASNSFKIQGAECSRFELELALDHYIVIKSWFLERHTQGVIAAPGLGNFRQSYSSTQIADRNMRLPSSQTRGLTSGRVYTASHLLPMLFTLEPGRNLRRIELRMAPLQSVREYVQFFQRWAKFEHKLGLDKLDNLRIAFAIHFKRSLRGTKRPRRADIEGEDDGLSFTPLGSFLWSLDRDSAVLHQFRTHKDPRLRSLASRIVRVDFAGQERDLSPTRVAYVVNLLRGDRAALAGLEEIASGLKSREHAFHSSWVKLHQQDESHHSISSLKLGLTCHAGEDFAHPVEGLYAIMSCVEHLKMVAGDTLGHGLAAGVDLSWYRRQSQPRILTSCGNMFDALIWLHRLILTEGDANFGRAAKVLETTLWDMADELYPGVDLPSSLPMFWKLNELRAGPVPERLDDPNTIAHILNRIHHDEYWDKQTRARRDKRIVAPLILEDLEQTIRWAQTRVLEKLVECGVALEFNPSSNWRVSRAKLPEEIPIIRIIQEMGDQVLATINTDNPGVFQTRIENEFAIVFDGLIQSGGDPSSRSTALKLLERMREVGEEFVYWPDPEGDWSKGEFQPAEEPSDGYRWPGTVATERR